MAGRKRRPRDRRPLREAPSAAAHAYREASYREALSGVPPWPGPHQARVQRLVSNQGSTLILIVGCPCHWRKLFIPEVPAPWDWLPKEAVDIAAENGCSELAVLPSVPLRKDDSEFSSEIAQSWFPKWENLPFDLDPTGDVGPV